MHKTMLRVICVFRVLLRNIIVLFFFTFRSTASYFSRFRPSAKISGDGNEAGCCDAKEEKEAATFDCGGATFAGEHYWEDDDDEGDGKDERAVLFETASSRKYEFSVGKGVSGFAEEPKAVSFVVQEMFADSDERSLDVEKEFFIHKEPEHSAGEEETYQDFAVEKFMDPEPIDKTDHEFFHEEESELEVEMELSYDGDEDEDASSEESQIEPWEEYRGIAGLQDEVAGEDDFSDRCQVLPKQDDGEALISEENYVFTANGVDENSAPDAAEPNQSNEEYIELELHEESHLSSDNIFEEEEEERGNLNFARSGELGIHKVGCSQLDSDPQDDSDSLWEHDDIVEQLKLELKNIRTGGLPTIMEESESESPKMAEDDLKPMKIDNKIEHKDRLKEIQKVYKSYAERMRKLDVLNYQTLHAIGLVQLKDPLKSNGTGGYLVSTVTSLLSQKSRKNKSRRHQIDPVMESVGTYYRELEMVYVGHVCLSWEILQWQYCKLHELKESSPRSFERYNQVAGEFQLFEVLLHRFLENEPFQGPRVENYVKNRCVMRNLLQVPAIRDDCIKDRKARVRDEDAVSSTGLIDVIEESMRVFWDFLHADKHEADAAIRGFNVKKADVQRSPDFELMMSIRTLLQKKERRLKDLSRSGNCIVKKLQRNNNNNNKRMDQELLIAQVELRLISRVLKMARLTRDQVAWCHEKLERINIVGRKIRVEVEPSFLLFPC